MSQQTLLPIEMRRGSRKIAVRLDPDLKRDWIRATEKTLRNRTIGGRRNLPETDREWLAAAQEYAFDWWLRGQAGDETDELNSAEDIAEKFADGVAKELANMFSGQDYSQRGASDRSAAGMAQLRKQVRIKAQVNVDAVDWSVDHPGEDVPDRLNISGRLWLDLGGADIAPFRYKAEVDDFGMGDIYVHNFRPISGMLAGGAKALGGFYEGALTEILKSKPSLLRT